MTYTIENYDKVNIEELALNSKFGVLKFDNANKKLRKIQEWLKEAESLNYQNVLPVQAIKLIDGYKRQLVEDINWLENFDISTSSNPKQEHDSFENKIDSRFNSVHENLVLKYLTHLRQEAALKSQNAQELQEQQKAAISAEQKYKDLAEKLDKRFIELDAKEKDIEEKKKQVETGHAELGAIKLAKHFENEAERYQTIADKWLKKRSIFYWAIIGILIIFALIYFELGWDKVTPQLGIAKIIFLSALWYGLSFTTRNFNIFSHLAAVNRHRLAVARTLEDFLESDPTRQAEILKYASEAMFKNAAIGFVSKTEKESSSPLYEIINNIFTSKNGQ